MRSPGRIGRPDGPVPVMHLTDTLEIGGAERMAVNLVNLLPRDQFAPHLCATRRGGPLSELVASDVSVMYLGRRSRLDLRAVRRLVRYVHAHDIRVLHAHGTAVFTAVAASLFEPYPAVVWHVHFGRYASDNDSGLLYRLVAWRVDHTVTVNEALARWPRMLTLSLRRRRSISARR